MKAFFASACLVVASTIAPAVLAADGDQIEKVVVLMRHGVRPPTNTADITPFAAEPWPDFGVADGMLTPHGAEAAKQLGAWERGWLGERGLFTTDGCPAPADVFAWSSRELQRTTDTGKAFLQGMFPGCALTVGRSAGSGPDPLFTASETDVGRLDLAAGKQAILERMGGSFDAPKLRVAGLMGELETVTGCCAVSVCQKMLGRNECRIDELPWAIEPSSEKRNLKITGPLSSAATMSQVFLLEYAQGLPADKVAWGRASSRGDVIRLSELRKVKYEYFERVPYIARRGASNILAQIATALTHDAGASIGLDLAGPPSAKYTLYVGSDTQIAEIGGILDLHWQAGGFLDDETPPTGGLIFERLRRADGSRSVRISFVTPTLDQIRGDAVLAKNAGPSISPMVVPACGEGQVCPLDRFAAIVGERIDANAVAQPDYR